MTIFYFPLSRNLLTFPRKSGDSDKPNGSYMMPPSERMKKTRRTYAREFKPEALGLLETSDQCAYQIECDLGISAGCLSRWKREQAIERGGVKTRSVAGFVLPDFRERLVGIRISPSGRDVSKAIEAENY